MIGPINSPTGYKYADQVFGTGVVKKLLWKQRKLVAVLKANDSTTIDFDLVSGVDQGLVDFELHSGINRVCMRCDSDGTHDGSDGLKFLGKSSSCVAPPTCLTSSGNARVARLVLRAGAPRPDHGAARGAGRSSGQRGASGRGGRAARRGACGGDGAGG